MTRVPLTEEESTSSPRLEIEAYLDNSVAPNIKRLVAYSPGKPVEEVERELGITGIIKLASNENSLGPSPKSIEAVQRLASKMHIYPDANCHALRHKIASNFDISPDSIVFGNGSDDIIHLLGITFLGECDEVIQADPSFVRYEAAAILNNARCHLVPLTRDWTHDLEAMSARTSERTRLVFICNPNNPTGTIVDRKALEKFMDRMPARALLVIDEAYHEYAAHDPSYPDSLKYVREGRNVITLRTFSKVYGLAGYRIGWGAMRPDIAGWLNRTREPFNVNSMAQVAAVAALDDEAHLSQTLKMNEVGKTLFYVAFEKLGLDYAPTHGNFVWVDVKRNSRAVFEKLLRKGVIVRTGDIFGAPTHLRITIGTETENAKFLHALEETLGGML